jgi:succinate dehydrogenase / fumarate reductase flavoprotein subunit
MLIVSQAVAASALERQESRGGHTRDDYPMTDPYWGALNVVIALKSASDVVPLAGEELSVKRQPLPKPPPELAKLLEDVH